MEHTLSPVATSSLRVEMTGNPAPTVASFKYRAPVVLLALKIFSYRPRSPEYAFLFGVTMLMPFSSHAGYSAATASDEVLSTTATLCVPETRAASLWVSTSKSGFSDEAESFDFQVEVGLPGAMGFAESKMVRVDEVREIRRKGDDWAGMERIWSTSSEPTRPTPTTAT